MIRQILASAILSSFSLAASALPVLQLDIAGGSYVGGSEESIMTSADIFTLYAYATPGGKRSSADILADTFYLSAALTPKVSMAGDYGSFTINGTTVNATDDMIFGKPPTTSAQQLGSHDIFDTYYQETTFQFDGTNTSGSYNTQDASGSGPISGSDMFYAAFMIDMTNLNENFELHFDLYDTKVKNNGLVTLDNFAPFSHDAGTMPPSVVPIPAAIWLFLGGIGMLGGVRFKHNQVRH